MSQTYQMPPFDFAKYKISESASKLHKYTLWQVLSTFAIFVLFVIAIFVILIPMGFSIADFDTNNLYELVESFFQGGAIIITFLAIIGIILIIISIMVFFQYYALGRGFEALYKIDPVSVSSQYASYGIMGYIIATIIGLFVPNVAGSVISILGSVSLAIGFYFVYRTFIDYRAQGRFRGSPTIMLFIAVAINLVSTIVSMFTIFATLGTIVGSILIIIGFRELAKDIMIIQPGATQPGPYDDSTTVQPIATHPAKPAPVDPIPKATDPHRSSDEVRFCSSCGAKVSNVDKFCPNCGGTI